MTHTHTLYIGRWQIRSTNALQDVGFIGLEVTADTGFRAIAYQDNSIFSKEISRHGKFRVIRPLNDAEEAEGKEHDSFIGPPPTTTATSHSRAVAAGHLPPGQGPTRDLGHVLCELEFEAENHVTLSVAGG